MLYGLKNSKTGQYYHGYEGYVDQPYKASFFVSQQNAEKRLKELKRGSCVCREDVNDLDDFIVVSFEVKES